MLKAPIPLYFDITPLTKISRHFTTEIDMCDRGFWECLEWVVGIIFAVGSKIAIALWFSPVLGIGTLVNFAAICLYHRYTLPTRLELRRL